MKELTWLEWGVVVTALGALAMLLFGGCAVYQPTNIEEWIAQAKQLDGSGCMYLRANARPYADVSVVAIHTYGKSAPKYLDCLQGIPPEARTLLP